MRAIISLLLMLAATPLAAQQDYGPPSTLASLNVIGTLSAGSYNLNNSAFVGVVGNYRVIYAGDGVQAISFFNAGSDTTTYLSSGAVAFRSRDYTTTFGTINSAGMSLSGFMAAGGAAYVAGSITANQTAKGALDYNGPTRAVRILGWSGDATPAGLEFWSGPAGANTTKVWSVSNAGAVTSNSLAGSGNRPVCVNASGTLYAATNGTC